MGTAFTFAQKNGMIKDNCVKQHGFYMEVEIEMNQKRYKRLRKTMIVTAMLFALAGCGKAQDAYDKAMDLATAGKYEKSLSHFEEAIKEDGDQMEFYIGYGMALNRLNRFEDAKKIFEGVLQDTDNQISKENNKQLYYGLAIADYGMGNYDDVISYCDKALEIEYFDDMNNDILYTQALAEVYTGNTKSAKKNYETIIKDKEKYLDAYTELAKVYASEEDTDKAIETYRKALEVDKTFYDADFALYELYMSQGQEDAANEVLNQLITISSKKATNLMVIGRAYYYKGDTDKAIEYLEMSYDANCKESSYYLGIVQADLKDYDNAQKSFEKYIKENKTDFNVDVYNQLASLYMEEGEYAKAQSAITKGLSCGNSSARQMLQKNQVLLYERQKKNDKAKEAATEYIKLYPNDAGMQKELEFIDTRIKEKK